MPPSEPPRGLPGVAPYSHPYSVFAQQVRQYRPSDLLPALAAWSARPVQHGMADPLKTRPWAVSAVAKESIVRGSERRTKPVGPDTIDRLLHSFFVVGDGSDAESLASLIVPIVYEQFPYHEAGMQSLARTKALLLDTPLPSHAGNDVADWESLFGMSLEDAWRTAFFLFVWANQNRGRYDAALLDSPQMTAVLRSHPRGHVELLVRRLTATIEEARRDYNDQERVPLRREQYGYNPLMRTPFIDLGVRGVYAPQPAFITHAVTPAGLFYAGSTAFGPRFPVQLGYRVETYVGRQLGSVPGAVVQPEITYGRPERKSVDWLVTTPNAVVLVECKSQRLPLDARSGGASLLTELAARLNKARAQISATADLVRTGAAPFDVIPGDRPIVGLVVTSEPLYLANSPAITGHLAPTNTPTLVASLRELEQLVAGRNAGELGRTLLDILTDDDRSTWNLGNALPDASRRNALLDEAWRELNAPLREARDA